MIDGELRKEVRILSQAAVDTYTVGNETFAIGEDQGFEGRQPQTADLETTSNAALTQIASDESAS